MISPSSSTPGLPPTGAHNGGFAGGADGATLGAPLAHFDDGFSSEGAFLSGAETEREITPNTDHDDSGEEFSADRTPVLPRLPPQPIGVGGFEQTSPPSGDNFGGAEADDEDDLLKTAKITISPPKDVDEARASLLLHDHDSVDMDVDDVQVPSAGGAADADATAGFSSVSSSSAPPPPPPANSFEHSQRADFTSRRDSSSRQLSGSNSPKQTHQQLRQQFEIQAVSRPRPTTPVSACAIESFVATSNTPSVPEDAEKMKISLPLSSFPAAASAQTPENTEEVAVAPTGRTHRRRSSMSWSEFQENMTSSYGQSGRNSGRTTPTQFSQDEDLLEQNPQYQNRVPPSPVVHRRASREWIEFDEAGAGRLNANEDVSAIEADSLANYCQTIQQTVDAWQQNDIAPGDVPQDDYGNYPEPTATAGPTDVVWNNEPAYAGTTDQHPQPEIPIDYNDYFNQQQDNQQQQQQQQNEYYQQPQDYYDSQQQQELQQQQQPYYGTQLDSQQQQQYYDPQQQQQSYYDQQQYYDNPSQSALYPQQTTTQQNVSSESAFYEYGLDSSYPPPPPPIMDQWSAMEASTGVKSQFAESGVSSFETGMSTTFQSPPPVYDSWDDAPYAYLHKSIPSQQQQQQQAPAQDLASPPPPPPPRPPPRPPPNAGQTGVEQNAKESVERRQSSSDDWFERMNEKVNMAVKHTQERLQEMQKDSVAKTLPSTPYEVATGVVQSPSQTAAANANAGGDRQTGSSMNLMDDDGVGDHRREMDEAQRRSSTPSDASKEWKPIHEVLNDEIKKQKELNKPKRPPPPKGATPRRPPPPPTASGRPPPVAAYPSWDDGDSAAQYYSTIAKQEPTTRIDSPPRQQPPPPPPPAYAAGYDSLLFSETSGGSAPPTSSWSAAVENSSDMFGESGTNQNHILDDVNRSTTTTATAPPPIDRRIPPIPPPDQLDLFGDQPPAAPVPPPRSPGPTRTFVVQSENWAGFDGNDTSLPPSQSDFFQRLNAGRQDDPFAPAKSPVGGGGGAVDLLGGELEDSYDPFAVKSADQIVAEAKIAAQAQLSAREAADDLDFFGGAKPDEEEKNEPERSSSPEFGFRDDFAPEAAAGNADYDDGPQSPLYDEDDSLPLLEFPSKFTGDGWELMLRFPVKKKMMAERCWKPVFVRIAANNIQLFYGKNDRLPFQELPLLANYCMSDVTLQQYDVYGKIHTVKLQFVVYKERVGIRPGQIPKLVEGHFTKLGLPLEHAAQSSVLLKFGSLNHNEIHTFVYAVEDVLFRIAAVRERPAIYKQDEVQVHCYDEYSACVNKDGLVFDQRARVRLFCLAFVSGSPFVEIGLNDRRRQGKEVVRRKDIMPMYTERWIRFEALEFHHNVDRTAFDRDHIIRMQPLDACFFEVLRFRVRPPRGKELPLQIRSVMKIAGSKIEIRIEAMAAVFRSRKARQVPCEDIQIRFPIPEAWIYLFREERHWGYGSVHAKVRRPGKVKNIKDRIMGMVQHTENSLIEAAIGDAKYEHVHRSLVWRIPRLPEKHHGAYKTHLLRCRFELSSFDLMPETFMPHCEVEYTMPMATVSYTVVRSVSLEQHEDPDKVEKWVRYLAKYQYTVEVDYVQTTDLDIEAIMDTTVVNPEATQDKAPVKHQPSIDVDVAKEAHGGYRIDFSEAELGGGRYDRPKTDHKSSSDSSDDDDDRGSHKPPLIQIDMKSYKY